MIVLDGFKEFQYRVIIRSQRDCKSDFLRYDKAINQEYVIGNLSAKNNWHDYKDCNPILNLFIKLVVKLKTMGA